MGNLYFGNTEILPKWIVELTQYFKVRIPDDTNEIFLQPKKATYTAAEVLDAIQLIGNLTPDECSLENDEIRLWWD